MPSRMRRRSKLRYRSRRQCYCAITPSDATPDVDITLPARFVTVTPCWPSPDAVALTPMPTIPHADTTIAATAADALRDGQREEWHPLS